MAATDAENGSEVNVTTEDNPFTPQDLQRLHEEAKAISDNNEWTFLKRTEDVELWKKSYGKSDVNMVKGFLHFPGIPPKDVLELIVNLDIRRQWEKQFPILETVEEYSTYKLIYWLVKTPIGAADRDFVQYMTHGQDDTGRFYILYKNTVHPSIPLKSGVVRAETLFSGTLLYPAEDDPNSTKLILVVQDDLKGHVPKFILNFFYGRAPIDWHHNLSTYYHNVYVKQKGAMRDDNLIKIR